MKYFLIVVSWLLKFLGQIIVAILPFLRKKIQYDYAGQSANDFIRTQIESNPPGGLMIVKLGTYELRSYLCFHSWKYSIHWHDVPQLLTRKYVLYRDKQQCMNRLCNNAGFFPNELSLGFKYVEMIHTDWKDVDILSSYQSREAYLIAETKHHPKARIDLNGFYAPFLWKQPWTSALRGKRVLVVHPFVDSIKKQYGEHRTELFDDPNVLPPFKELILVKAVQSIGNTPVQYADWFEALSVMKSEIDKHDYDVALIGCGAYGFHLAAHIKRRGKIAIQLAGWTQVLFGIYGNRWTTDQPEFAPFIKESWVRPTDDERPKNAHVIENGCYW